MMHCRKCDVDFTGDLTSCPLCGHTLDGTPEPSPFPVIERQIRHVQAGRILAGVTLAALLGVVLLAIYFKSSPLGALIACAALILNYVFVRNVVLYKPSFLRMIQRYYLVLVAMAFALFIVTLNSTVSSFVSSFVIPALCIIGMLFNATLITVYRARFVKTDAKYILFVIILGCLPLLLLLTGTVTWPWLIYASAALAVLIFAGLLIFARIHVKEEAKKLFSA